MLEPKVVNICTHIVIKETLTNLGITPVSLEHHRLVSLTEDKFRIIDELDVEKVIVGDKLELSDLIDTKDFNTEFFDYEETQSLGFIPETLLEVWFHKLITITGIKGFSMYDAYLSFVAGFMHVRVKENHPFLKGSLTIMVTEEYLESLNLIKEEDLSPRRGNR